MLEHYSEIWFSTNVSSRHQPIISRQEVWCNWAKSKSLRCMLLEILVGVGSWALEFVGFPMFFLCCWRKKHLVRAFLFSFRASPSIIFKSSKNHLTLPTIWPLNWWISELRTISNQGPTTDGNLECLMCSTIISWLYTIIHGNNNYPFSWWYCSN